MVFATLNIKQEKFCVEYAKCGNATEAYRLAGYKAKTDDSAYVQASKMVRNSKVKARLAELVKENNSPKIATAVEIQEGLSRLHREAVEKGDVLGASKTADILNKMQGTYVNKTELSVSASLADVLGAIK